MTLEQRQSQTELLDSVVDLLDVAGSNRSRSTIGDRVIPIPCNLIRHARGHQTMIPNPIRNDINMPPLHVSGIKTRLFAVVFCLPLLCVTPIWADDAPAVKPESKEEFTTRLFFSDADASNLKPVVNLPEYQAQGSPNWSQDGKLIAFDAWMPQKGESFQNSNVIVVNADGTEPRVFADAGMPSFSPAGRRVVVSRPKAGGVWIIDLDKAAPDNFQLLDENGWGADWSHDGKIVYATRGDTGANLTIVDAVDGKRTVFGGERTPYKFIAWNMAWSRDGKRIAYLGTNREGKKDVGIVEARGDQFGLVTPDSGNNTLASFAFHPDGTVLFVKHCDERAHFQIYSVAPDGKGEAKILAGCDPERSYADIAYSPDGKQILISCWKRIPTAKPVAKLEPAKQVPADEAPDAKEEYNTKLFVANPDAANMKAANNLKQFQKQGSPNWSLDGKLIAFDVWMPQQGETFTNSKVVVMNADGTEPRVFEDAAMPSFSPGGRRVVVSRPKAGGIWVINLNGQEQEEFIPIDPLGWGADWSPDGRLVYATHGGSGANLKVVDLVEGGRRVLLEDVKTPYRQIFWNMAWSRDSKFVAFKATNQDGKLEIGIVDSRGEGFGLKRRVEDDLYASFAWSPDSSHILFTKKCAERDRIQIYSITPDLKEAPKLLTGLDPERHYSDVAYGPDGKQILLTCHKRTPITKPVPGK
ncbi:MAG: translocation protein TolB [Planctomycetaceae bacterium]|nr:translocation protein TolB [Planctomycetaceae bacterium]